MLSKEEQKRKIWQNRQRIWILHLKLRRSYNEVVNGIKRMRIAGRCQIGNNIVDTRGDMCVVWVGNRLRTISKFVARRPIPFEDDH